MARAATWVAPAVALIALTSGLAAISIIEINQYPYPMWRGLVFRYLLFRQDLAGLGLLVGLALLACIPATQAAALRLVEAIGRRPAWRPSSRSSCSAWVSSTWRTTMRWRVTSTSRSCKAASLPKGG